MPADTELEKTPSVQLTDRIDVLGRVVHALTKAPLPKEAVVVHLPGGGSASAVTDENGTFVITLGPTEAKKITRFSIGDLPSVPSGEREKGESAQYQLFLTRVAAKAQ
jgi:hypothetical protein